MTSQRKWERLKVWTIADTDVLKAITKRVFLKSSESVADLWAREDGAFIKIRGYRGSFEPGKIFQVKIPTDQFKADIRQYVDYLLKGIPESEPRLETETDWRANVLVIWKNGSTLMMTDEFPFLSREELVSVREFLTKAISRIDLLLELREQLEKERDTRA